MNRSTRVVAALLVCVAVGTSACTPRARVTMLRKHPEVTQRSQHLHSIAIVPPQLTVEEQRLTEASERLRDMEEQLRQRIVNRVSTLLSQRGFTLVPAHLDDGDLGDNQALRLALTRLRGGSAHLANRLYWKGAIPVADANQVQMTIGPVVNRFADRAGADAIVMLQGEVITKSAGMRQKDTFFEILAALGGAYRPHPIAGGWIDLQLIDATSGDLLWANRGGAVFYKEVDIDFLMNQVLNDFDLWRPTPAAGGTAEVPQSAPTAAPDHVPQSHGDAAGNRRAALAPRLSKGLEPLVQEPARSILDGVRKAAAMLDPFAVPVALVTPVALGTGMSPRSGLTQ